MDSNNTPIENAQVSAEKVKMMGIMMPANIRQRLNEMCAHYATNGSDFVRKLINEEYERFFVKMRGRQAGQIQKEPKQSYKQLHNDAVTVLERMSDQDLTDYLIGAGIINGNGEGEYESNGIHYTEYVHTNENGLRCIAIQSCPMQFKNTPQAPNYTSISDGMMFPQIIKALVKAKKLMQVLHLNDHPKI